MTDYAEEEKFTKQVIISTLCVMAVIAIIVPLITSPADKLLGDSAYRIRSAFHGLFAWTFMITSVIGLYQALRLWRGVELNLGELKVGSVINAATCFLAILFGNWVYIPYRAPGGPRTDFLATVPEVHQIFFEFKEFAALFTLPLTIAAAYIICRYSFQFTKNQVLREIVVLLLILSFFYFIVSFGLGAAITKIKSV
jgi:hypothetical protein